jgi:hypothetical protein
MAELRVAVALAVVMILKPHAGTGMVRVIAAHRMAWYSTSSLTGTHPEGTATATKGDPADAQGQGQGRLVNDMSGGEAIAGTRTGG